VTGEQCLDGHAQLRLPGACLLEKRSPFSRRFRQGLME
jgi:hypothetical protein